MITSSVSLDPDSILGFGPYTILKWKISYPMTCLIYLGHGILHTLIVVIGSEVHELKKCSIVAKNLEETFSLKLFDPGLGTWFRFVILVVFVAHKSNKLSINFGL